MTRVAARTCLAIAAALAALAGGGYALASGRAATAVSAPVLRVWPEFGLDPQRSNATDLSTGITAANLGQLSSRTIALPGTVDSSPIYLHGAAVAGGRHDTAFVTTDYGITVALDATSGKILWTFAPRGRHAWLGSGQVTTSSPILDPDQRYLYATSPNGVIHKLAIEDGREQPGWPVRITPTPDREKLTASLNISGGYLLASTGGYYGDAPPYVGHIVAISLTDHKVAYVFNTLCADRDTIIMPSSCSASDSAILSRSGPVVEPGGGRVLIATGNGPYNGTTDFGDSVIELTLPTLKLRQAYTPTDQAKLNSGDLDLGSGSPAILPGGLAWIAGKDGIQRVLNLSALDGSAPGTPPHTGGELQTLPTPAGQQLFTAPAVWGKLMFVADDGGTTAYRVSGGHMHELWSNGTAGTSPIVAGGLLYVYNPGGSLVVYRPASGRVLATLQAASGHWNSPIVVDGHIIVPTGNDNDHLTSGSLEIYSAR
ncbi:MAG TPA: PQQ-binding-like beta-propeller repeat protein [Solirubrobacteraceae bacterium]|nr:PQQ-binding-like beta-propeller repeat protein [Solirubrobacteraceae bacterium]